MITSYSVISTKKGREMYRKYNGKIKFEGEIIPFDGPWFPAVLEIESQHDNLFKEDPTRKRITTIIEEE